MASPESTRNNKVLRVMSPMVFWLPTINTMIQEKISTTMVLKAVATLESVFLIPHFARIPVRPAKKADPNANKSHIISCLLSAFYYESHRFFPQAALQQG